VSKDDVIDHTARPYFWHDVLIAGACAALLSTIPSTVHAWWMDHDIMEATRAAGAMLIPANSNLRVIGPVFPEVYALPFWPQFADHLAWGGTLRAVLSWRFRTRARTQQNLPSNRHRE
jgi:hypothetical protein